MEIASIAGAVASIILAIIAIVLSAAFYHWSQRAEQDAQRASDRIERSVTQLETLYQTTFSETFNMLRDATVETQNRLMTQHQSMLERMLETQSLTVARIGPGDQTNDGGSAAVSSEIETVILEALKGRKTHAGTGLDLYQLVLERWPAQGTAFFPAMQRLRAAGHITYEGDTIDGNTFVRLTEE